MVTPAIMAANYRTAFFRLGGGLLLSCAFFFLWGDPLFRGNTLAENGLVENLSAAFWFMAFCVGFPACLAVRGKRRFLPLPLLSLVAALDEASFSIPFVTNPQSVTVAGHEFDGVHDLFSFSMMQWAESGSLAVYIAGSVALGVAVGCAVVFRGRYMPQVMACVRRYPQLDFLRYATILVFVAQLLDLDLVASPWALFFEETFEMLGGLAMFFGALAMRRLPPEGVLPAEDVLPTPPETLPT